ncbi:hypothetical protein BOTCAL_1538g00020 [Botryotinia calthae]|uniref:Uncharacterized protein n=1 Tax=Botryotinia calthae TaxID=38488 RepID=A0A4Y8CE43_9HELO|nr:hypothetical protein BOTCAL_1538g00020 [Botryotinia calthae]
MNEMAYNELVEYISKFNLTKAREAVPILQELNNLTFSDLTEVKSTIRVIKEQARSRIERYQRASYKVKQKKESNLRRALKNSERDLIHLKKQKEDLEEEETRTFVIVNMMRDHLQSLMEGEAGKMLEDKSVDTTWKPMIQTAGGNHGHHAAERWFNVNGYAWPSKDQVLD